MIAEPLQHKQGHHFRLVSILACRTHSQAAMLLTFSTSSLLGLFLPYKIQPVVWSFQFSPSVITPCPAVKTCGVFRNWVLPSSSFMQPTVVAVVFMVSMESLGLLWQITQSESLTWDWGFHLITLRLRRVLFSSHVVYSIEFFFPFNYPISIKVTKKSYCIQMCLQWLSKYTNTQRLALYHLYS